MQFEISVLSWRLMQNGPRKNAWFVYTHRGRKPTNLNTISWAKEVVDRGAGEILLTSMDRDGTKDGYDIALTRQISDTVEVPVIASGGVGNPTYGRGYLIDEQVQP